MWIFFLRANYFEGNREPDADTPTNGTLEGDCTGIFNNPFLGGVQPYVYYPENCTIAMSTSGNVFQNRDNDCPGIYFSLHTLCALLLF